MSYPRKIRTLMKSKPEIEGAGVHLKRVFGVNEVPMFDPFLLFDDFRSDNPEHYLKGFPWHPHRGIETITYVIDGEVEHGDSMGNKGSISCGDVQWMTAGSGIIHQEMPKGDKNGRMGGFQLWANLPASQKMMPPRYRDVKSSQIPEIVTENGTKIRVVCGQIFDREGPVRDIVIDPEYLDVTVPANAEFVHPTKPGHIVFAYVIGGQGCFSQKKDSFTQERDGEGHLEIDENPSVDNETLVLFGEGDKIAVSTETQPVRFLLISGNPIEEPVAWRGPIVMNTQDELRIAFEEYNNGTFIKHNKT